MDLVIIQQRSTLLVGWDNGSFPAEGKFLAKDARDGDEQGEDEEERHDDEGEDPLECNDLGQELSNSEGGG